MKNQKKTVYYSDELNDEFAGDSIKARHIDETYFYGDKSPWWMFKSWFWYRLIAHPIAIAYLKISHHWKIVNKKVIKQGRRSSFFIYGNHTNNGADALIPTFTSFPKKTYVIVHPNNVSMPVLGKVTPYLGALPLPDNMAATKNFMNVIKMRVEQNASIMIYPEAHIWPYYTKIRPFTDLSFRYPVQYDKPVFCLTNTYQKRKCSSKPKMVTYVDGPFYADKSLSSKEQRKDLRDRVYNTMVERAKNSNVELINYVKKEKEEEK